MWIIIQELLPWLLIILLITQIIYPLVTDTRMFWLFRGKAKTKDSSLFDELEETKSIVSNAKDKVNSIKAKANDYYKSAKDIKDSSDSLL